MFIKTKCSLRALKHLSREKLVQMFQCCCCEHKDRLQPEAGGTMGKFLWGKQGWVGLRMEVLGEILIPGNVQGWVQQEGRCPQG